MDKRITLILILSLFASTLVLADSAWAQTTPSVPEFNLNFVRTYYAVNVTGKSGFYDQTFMFENNTIEVAIKNQPYQTTINGTDYHLMFNVRMKMHFEENWSELYPLVSLYNDSSNFNLMAQYALNNPNATSSDFTVLSFYDYYPSYPPDTEIDFVPPFHYPPGSQVDIEVEAIVGHDSQAYIANHPTYPWLGGNYEPAIAFDVASDWSKTQTITSPGISPTPSPPSSSPLSNITFPPTFPPEPFETPEITASPTISSQITFEDLELAIILVLAVALAIVSALLIRTKKRTAMKCPKAS